MMIQFLHTCRILVLNGCFLLGVSFLPSCERVLEPPPVDLLVDDLVLNTGSDMEAVRLGLYNALRSIGAPAIMAGDFTADLVQFNGTFTDYNELGNKNITAANGVVGQLWSSVYSTAYVANFIEEKIEDVTGAPQADKDRLLAEARFCRAYAYFIAANTYGDVPLVRTTDVDINRNIPKTSQAEILAFVKAELEAALEHLPDAWDANSNAVNKQFATKNAARALLARYYLYSEEWANAETIATQLINTRRQVLDSSYVRVITTEFDTESIFEVAYGNTSTDDPGTSTFSLNNVLVGRREMIPSNTFIAQLYNSLAGDRIGMVRFRSEDQQGADNGWTVLKYGTADQSNNNITLFRLAEIYLIRAEARAKQNKITGNGGALADVNILRARAKAPLATFSTAANALTVIEQERLLELAFEGHRWYDLKRTGRLQAIMSAFTTNWNEKYSLWPIPQSEIQRNPALQGQQNPGY